MKKYFLCLCILFTVLAGFAQISIQPVIPLSGMIQKSNLWNIAVINTSGVAMDCRLELTLRDRVSGLEVITATTGQFLAESGARQVNASLLMPIQYNFIAGAVSQRTDDFIPIGNYTACYRLTANKNTVAEECVAFDVEPLSPPMLINPPDSFVTDVAPSQFSWVPPAPLNLFSRLQYEVLITEIMPGQKAEEAMQQNLPFYTEPNISVNNLPYNGTAATFEKDKWYAWQVVARDEYNYAGKSEVWVFKVSEPSIFQMIMQSAPYVKMRKDAIENGTARNGMLRLSYMNETTDSIASISIKDLSEPTSKPFSFSIPIRQGENLIEYNVKRKFNLKDGHIYSASLVNSRNENWRIQFEIQMFDPKN